MTTITSFINRLKKIGVEVELSVNFPWVYLDIVNGHRVFEKYYGNHGFTVFLLASKPGKMERITNIEIIFNKIREMLTEEGRKKDYQKFISFEKSHQS